MPTSIKSIEISDEGLPRVQVLLDAQNDTRTKAGMPAFTLDEFVQSELNDHFQIQPEQLKTAAIEAVKEKLSQATDLAKIAAISAAVDAELAK